MNYIDSVQNVRVKMYSKLKEKKYREEWKNFLIEGEHLIEEALKAHLVQVLFCMNGSHPFKIDPADKVELIHASEQVMQKLSTNMSTPKYVAVCKFMPKQDIEGKRIIVLDDVQDPGNVGTIIRSALSFGFDGVILSDHGVDLYNEKLIRSTQGAIFRLPIERGPILPRIKELKNKGYYIVGTSLQNGCGLGKIMEHDKMVIVLGNEGSGVSTGVLVLSDINAFIEMENFESLNVGVAAGIMMYTFRANKE